VHGVVLKVTGPCTPGAALPGVAADALGKQLPY
jgi:hypothetical protein